MAQTIKIKRSTGSSAPSTLAVGELAYTKGTDTFYIGDPANANTPIAIGGAIKNNAGTPVLATGVTAAEVRSLISVDAAGTDNSTSVTLATVSGNYLSLSGQAITAGTVPLTLGGTGATSAAAARTNLDLVPGTDVLAYDANLQSFVAAFTLPTSDGSANQVLKTNGSGTLSFSSDTDVDVSIANLTARLPQVTESVTIGDGTDVTVTMAGALTVTGNLTVNGTTTTVNSTTTTLDDPIMTLGGDSAPGSDDNKDRGLEFRWHNGSAAKLGFFGFDDSTGKFTFIPDATNSSEVFSGTAGTIAAATFEGNLTMDSVALTTVQTSGESFADNNTSIMTSAAIDDRILSYGYSTTTGDITSVQISSSDSSISGTGTGSSGAISFDLEVATIDGGTY
tara:strand:+ start:1299 stop:2480 length:1182 start_codon:yes stop_codon:yes gene_type:complete